MALIWMCYRQHFQTGGGHEATVHLIGAPGAGDMPFTHGWLPTMSLGGAARAQLGHTEVDGLCGPAGMDGGTLRMTPNTEGNSGQGLLLL